jgi:hypothetical protein
MKMPIAEYAMLLLACVACTGPDRGCTANYSEGDQFKITVNGNQPGYGSCSLMPLNPGVNFVVAASGQMTRMTNQGCYSLAAEGVEPDFAKGVVTTCKPGDEQLGIECDGVTADGCHITMWTEVNQTPSASQKVIEDALFYVTWGTGLTDAGVRCLPDCTIDRYDVRIERLEPTADN